VTEEDSDITRRLWAEQRRRESHEADEAETAGEPDDAQTHARRAEQAGYLREKLEDRAAAERHAEAEGTGG
jgi:hypothetical protein